jgi:hypothetical protein
VTISKFKNAVRSALGWKAYRFLAMCAKAPSELMAIRRWRQSALGEESVTMLAELQGIHKGQRAFIIGNGPSLNRMDLRLLKNEVSIGSNGIFLAFEKMGFVPTYYTIEDPLVAADRAGEAANISGAQRVYPHDLAGVLGRQSAIYVPFRRSYLGFPKFGEDLRRAAYWGGTVTAFNLQLAFHLGCDPVYLIGCDHNYVVKADVQKDGSRFTSMSDDPNHFDPSYFGKGYRWHDPNVDRMEQSYVVCRRHYESEDRQVFNATVGGRLEVFPRVQFEELF